MAFIDTENIIAIMEGLLKRMWKEILNLEIPNPIPRMEYDEAMNKYGSDRPDLRFGMPLFDITQLAHSTDFGVFKSAPMVKAICVRVDQSSPVKIPMRWPIGRRVMVRRAWR